MLKSKLIIVWSLLLATFVVGIPKGGCADVWRYSDLSDQRWSGVMVFYLGTPIANGTYRIGLTNMDYCKVTTPYGTRIGDILPGGSTLFYAYHHENYSPPYVGLNGGSFVQWQTDGEGLQIDVNTQGGNYIVAGLSGYPTLTSYGTWYYDGLAEPQITNSPKDVAATSGSNATLVVGVSGLNPLSYTWTYDGTILNDETNATLFLTNLSPSNVGLYQVVVSNAYGSETSSVAHVTIPDFPTSITPRPTYLAGNTNQFILTITGLTGQPQLLIQVSTNLTSWETIYTNGNIFGGITITDSIPELLPASYYRAMTKAGPY